MILLHVKRALPFLVVGFFCLNPAVNLFAQIPNYTAPIPLNMGDLGRTDPNTNSVLFFQHEAVPNSTGNFRDAPSRIRFDNEETTAGDLLGAPGLKPQSGAPALLDMLVSTEGLCLEHFIPDLTCSNNFPLAIPQLRQSWSQLVADLRNTFPGEGNIPNVALTHVTLSGDPLLMPYKNSPLGSVVSIFNLNLESPPAVCYDITAAEDWIACPVFGWVFMTAEPSPDSSLKGQKILELQSPILLYRANETGLYKLAGYLANPSIEDQNKWAGFGADFTKYRFGNVHFPIAIASGNFSETPEAPDRADIAVVGTATLPHPFCVLLLVQLQLQLQQMQSRQTAIGSFPHGLNCSYGYTWVRTQEQWSTPRDTFDSKDYFLAGPRTYDLATGLDEGKAVLFAPSNAPARTLTGEDQFYVYKFYEEGMPAISLPAISIPNAPSTLPMPPMQQIPPRAIPVVPPKKGYGPFKIATADINNDGYADFALTWKSVAMERFDTTHNLWKADYSPFVSVYVSEARGGGGVIYDLKGDFQVPKTDSPSIDDEAQLAAVSFLQKKAEKTYLVVGNQKRILVNGRHHAFDYFFPISSGGVVDTIHVKPVQVSFKGEDAAAPGVADITVDFKGNVASVLRRPFIPAPEGCDVTNGEVYGALWFGEIFRKFPPLFDRQRTGVPNRCRCDKPADNVFPPFVGDDSIDPRGTEVPKACRVVTRSAPSSNSRNAVSKVEEVIIGELIQNTDLFPPPPGTGVTSTPPPSSTPSSSQQQDSPAKVSPPKERPCGFLKDVFSGPLIPCDEMGDGPREVTAILVKAVVPEKACDPTKDEACKPESRHQGVSLNQFCIAKVGRDDPKTSAVFEEDRKRIQSANDRAQSITGIKDFDIFVGGEAGAVHWECALIGGAFASASKVVGALPNVSGNVAPFAVWQTTGVPPLKFINRPMPELEIKNPLRLTPVDVSDAGTVGDTSSLNLSRSINLNAILPSVSGEEFMTGEGVQAGDLNYNINGKVMIKVLQSGDDFSAEGTSLSVSPLESLFALDFVAYPALLTGTVQDSQLSFDDVFKELEKRVEEYKMAGLPITIDIYRNLPWEKTMSPEFLIAQAKLPDAVTAANLALQPPSGTSLSTSTGPITNDPNQIVLPAYILPPGVYASGGGCGCRFNVRMQPDIILFQLLLLLVPLAGVIYYRHSLSRKK